VIAEGSRVRGRHRRLHVPEQFGGGAGAPRIDEVAARQLRSFVPAGEVRKMATCAIGLICGKTIRRLGGRVHRGLAPAGDGDHRQKRDGSQERRCPDKHFSCAFYRKPARADWSGGERPIRAGCMILSMRGGPGFYRLAILLAAGCAGSTAQPAAIDFTRDIRPILPDKCYPCHRPDESKRKSRLRLVIEAGAKADLGGHFAIVPGEPAKSELVRRVTAADRFTT